MSLTGVALNWDQEAGRTVLFWVIAGLQAPFSAPAEQISDQSLGHSLSTCRILQEARANSVIALKTGQTWQDAPTERLKRPGFHLPEREERGSDGRGILERFVCLFMGMITAGDRWHHILFIGLSRLLSPIPSREAPTWSASPWWIRKSGEMKVFLGRFKNGMRFLKGIKFCNILSPAIRGCMGTQK